MTHVRKYQRILLELLFVTGLILSFTPIALAANWYVDNSVSSSGNGQSWATAWKNLSSISWGSVSGGDFIYISGGSASKTYAESFTIGGSGSSNNYITIAPGAASPSPNGHNGNVIIKGSSGYGGIYLSAKNWIKISGDDGAGNQKIIVDNSNMGGAAGIYLDSMTNAMHIILEYLEVKNVNSSCPFDSALIYGISTTVPYVEISHCYLHNSDSDGIYFSASTDEVNSYGRYSIHDSTILDMRDDGVQSTWSGMDFYNNIIGDRKPNACSNQHPDTFQIQNHYYRIYNNIIRNWMVDGQANENTIYYETMWASSCGYFQIYNNLFYEASNATGGTWAICLAMHSVCTSISNIYVLNNTFVGPYQADILMALVGATNITSSSQFHDVYFENNIHNHSGGYNNDSSTGGGFTPTKGNHGSGSNWIIDYNDFYSVSASGGSHSITSNPTLDVNFKPNAGSPVLNKGISWSSLFTTYKDGTNRASGTTWDMGAYPPSTGVAKLLMAPQLSAH